MRTLMIASVAMGMVACGGSNIDSETLDHREDKGATLTGDGDLVIHARMFDGVQESTKHKRFTKVTVERGGESAEYWCDNRGDVADNDDRTYVVSCGNWIETISNDDDEAFSFSLIMAVNDGVKSYYIENFNYMGDGTFLADEAELLTGIAFTNYWDYEYALDDLRIDLTSEKKDDKKRDPFAMLQWVANGLDDFIGSTVYYDDVEADLKVRNVSFSLDRELTMSVYGSLSKSGSIGMSMPERVSLLKTPGVLAEGYTNQATLLSRVQASFAGDTAPTNVSDAIANAITPLGGPIDGLAREVSLDDVPEAVKVALLEGGNAIASREFEGTDYSAEVFGYYAIYASGDHDAPVAYVVWGGGAGEPDYHDGLVYGYDLEGVEIYFDEMDG